MAPRAGMSSLPAEKCTHNEKADLILIDNVHMPVKTPPEKLWKSFKREKSHILS